jgi:hypothetical protein
MLNEIEGDNATCGKEIEVKTTPLMANETVLLIEHARVS